LSQATGVPETLRALAREVIAEGRAALSDPSLADTEAVHEFRKAMKRWRAFLRLLQPYLGDEGRRMRLEAAELARGLAGARDAGITLDALDDLGKGEQKLSPRTAKTIVARLDAMRAQAEVATLTPEARARIDQPLALAAEQVKFWPLATISYRDLATELTEGYRRARDAIPRDWNAADPETLHDVRKRVVVHRYQMEIIEPLWPRFGQFWVGETQRLRERLGHCQDLIVLARLTEPHQLLARWRSRLAPLIAARRGQHVVAAARIAGRLFADSPKAFRRRLLALWDDDVAPAAAAASASPATPAAHPPPHSLRNGRAPGR
jgi:CHAD domain-containing protein